MKILVPAIAALGLAFASVPAMAQDAAAPPAPATDPAAPPPPAPDAATPPAAPMAQPAPDASAAPPAPMGTTADTAKPEAAPTNPPVCRPGVTDRCVQSAADQRMAAKVYSDRLPHNDNAAMHGGGKTMAKHRHRK